VRGWIHHSNRGRFNSAFLALKNVFLRFFFVHRENSSKRDEIFMNATRRTREMWDFPYATMCNSNCIYYIAQQFSNVINGMIYSFNFIFCHCWKMFLVCEDNQGEGAKVINVACASEGESTWSGENPMAVP
jgi:hypothetical protein